MLSENLSKNNNNNLLPQEQQQSKIKQYQKSLMSAYEVLEQQKQEIRQRNCRDSTTNFRQTSKTIAVSLADTEGELMQDRRGDQVSLMRSECSKTEYKSCIQSDDPVMRQLEESNYSNSRLNTGLYQSARRKHNKSSNDRQSRMIQNLTTGTSNQFLQYLNNKTLNDESLRNSGSNKKRLRLQSQQPRLQNCRFCLDNVMEEPDNPLIAPCNCTGNHRLIHVNCLKKWINSKLDFQLIKNGYILQLKKAKCQICLKSLPLRVKVLDKELTLIQVKSPKQTDEEITAGKQNQYVVLESIELSKTNERKIYVLKFPNNSIQRLGRSNKCQIRIEDASISREHCYFITYNNYLHVSDNQSKFGTLFLADRPINIHPNATTKTILIGRTMLHLSIKKSNWSSLFNPCKCIGGAQMPDFRNDTIDIDPSKYYSSSNNKNRRTQHRFVQQFEQIQVLNNNDLQVEEEVKKLLKKEQEAKLQQQETVEILRYQNKRISKSGDGTERSYYLRRQLARQNQEQKQNQKQQDEQSQSSAFIHNQNNQQQHQNIQRIQEYDIYQEEQEEMSQNSQDRQYQNVVMQLVESQNYRQDVNIPTKYDDDDDGSQGYYENHLLHAEEESSFIPRNQESSVSGVRRSYPYIRMLEQN